MLVPSSILASATPPTSFSCLSASPVAEPLTPIDGSWVLAPFGMIPAKPSPRLRDRIWAPCPEEGERIETGLKYMPLDKLEMRAAQITAIILGAIIAAAVIL